MTKKEKIKAIQSVLGVKTDGAWGPISQGAFDELIHGITPDDDVHPVVASSFADVADVAAFDKCKSKGHTDNYCFKYGDNGIGYWGDNTKQGSGPSCALPPETMEETWGSVDDARYKKVAVQSNGNSVVCEVKDTMPARKNITNGAGIDLNPDACQALGLAPPVMARATWEVV